MDQLAGNMPLLVFLVTGVIAVASAILVVSMRNPVHSALFLLLTFLCVAVLFVLKSAEFVAAVQILVYAGGVMVLFLFAVMLINVRNLPDERVLSNFWKGGFVVAAAIFLIFVTIVRTGEWHAQIGTADSLRSVPASQLEAKVNADGTVTPAPPKVVGNSEAVGTELYTAYLVPFEVASLFLLVAMIGAIVIGKRELGAVEEETAPDYMLDRVKTEHEVKEAVGA